MLRLLFIFLFAISLFAADVAVKNNEKSLDNLSMIQLQKLQELKSKIEILNKTIEHNIWYTRYSNYTTYQNLTKELQKIKKNIKKYKRKRDKKSKKIYEELLKKEATLKKQIEFLKEFEKAPFEKMMKQVQIPPAPSVTNPLAIIGAFSYTKQLEQIRADYSQRLQNLDVLIDVVGKKLQALENINKIKKNYDSLKAVEEAESQLSEFIDAKEVSNTTLGAYSKKVDEVALSVELDIKSQIKKSLNIAIFIIFIIALAIFLKVIAKKYIQDNERFYMVNKSINFVNFIVILFVLLFAYIGNVTYVVTVLGFASAGIAIAMKDLFMSMLGWLVIVFGGSFHVGDRVKVQKDGLPYVGDIIDISLLRMTILEDITLTTYLENRRSGRVVFIPNNYIFTTLISNYTHGTLKTVWDGIDFAITFNSNHKKAVHIIRGITKRYAKGYTDIARKQLNRLRSEYSLKSINVEPRVYTFWESYGIVVSAWYQTNSYAALTLRSRISADVVDAINAEDDIFIAYPTQTINLKDSRKDLPLDIDSDIVN